FDRKSRLRDGPAERRRAVAAHLAAEHRMVTAQDVHGRDVDHRMSARARHAEHLRQRRVLIVVAEGVEHVERRDQVERLTGEWRGGDRGAHQPAAAPRSADLQTGGRHVESVSRTKFCKEGQVGTGPATTVKNADACGASERPAKERCDEPSEAAKPEMTRFGARCGAQQIVHNVLYWLSVSASIDGTRSNS